MKQIEIDDETKMYVQQRSNGLRWCFGQILLKSTKETETTAAAAITAEQQRGGKQINSM